MQDSGTKPHELRQLSFLISPGLCRSLDPQTLNDIHYTSSFAFVSQHGIKAEILVDTFTNRFCSCITSVELKASLN